MIPNATSQLPLEPAKRPTRLRVTLALVVIQAVLTVFALVMNWWATLRWLGAIGFAFLGFSAIVAEIAVDRRGTKFWLWSLPIAWAFTLALPLSCWLVPDERGSFNGFLDYYYAVLAWVIAAMTLPAMHRGVRLVLKNSWKVLMISWASIGTLVWIATAYVQNEWSAFQVGLLLALAVLIICKLCLALWSPVIQLANTLILIVIGLLLTGALFNHAHEINADPKILKRFYCYRTALQNWKAHEQWCEYFRLHYYQKVEPVLLIKDSREPVPIRTRPNSRARLVDCDISVNSKGFRGREISDDKGSAYRIVALGESTTFGLTIERGDKPWPELFEAIVRERLKPNRPVEVINAGVPGITLPENLRRFPEDILPLKPDMIICYHGINGFPLLDDAVPPLRGKPPPEFHQRPLRLLANCEYNLRLLFYRQTQSSRLFFNPPKFFNLLETKYAAAYEDLIQIARTNGIRLVIANFPLAINAQSPPELVDFFRKRYSGAYWYLRGNIAHNQLVHQLVQKYPEVAFVDTQPHIDGEEEKYLDLMHLTQEGDRQLAENFFAGLHSVLEAELSVPTATSKRAAK